MASKKITLKSSNGEVFEVYQEVAMKSQTIKHIIEDDYAESGIPLLYINSKILTKVIEYCKKHVESNSKGSNSADDKVADEEIKTCDAEFVNID